MFNVEILLLNLLQDFLKLFHRDFAGKLVMAEVHRSAQSFIQGGVSDSDKQDSTARDKPNHPAPAN